MEFNRAGFNAEEVLQAVRADPSTIGPTATMQGAGEGALAQHLSRAPATFEEALLHPQVKRMLDEFGVNLSFDTFYGGGPATRPLWANSPYGRVLMFLHNFAYQQVSTIWNRMFKIIAAPNLTLAERATEVGNTAVWLAEATALGHAQNYVIDALKTVLHSVLQKKLWSYDQWVKERKKHPTDWRWGLLDDMVTGIGTAPVVGTVKFIANARDPAAAIANELVGAVGGRFTAVAATGIRYGQRKARKSMTFSLGEPPEAILRRDLLRELLPMGIGYGIKSPTLKGP